MTRGAPCTSSATCSSRPSQSRAGPSAQAGWGARRVLAAKGLLRGAVGGGRRAARLLRGPLRARRGRVRGLVLLDGVAVPPSSARSSSCRSCSPRRRRSRRRDRRATACEAGRSRGRPCGVAGPLQGVAAPWRGPGTRGRSLQDAHTSGAVHCVAPPLALRHPFG